MPKKQVGDGNTRYEWYLGYQTLKSILRRHIPLDVDILQVSATSSDV